MISSIRALLEADDRALAAVQPGVFDLEFIAEHTHGLQDFMDYLRSHSWQRIEAESGLERSALEAAATEYANATRVIAVYGMGLTQHWRSAMASKPRAKRD
jgi:anaerobic selenocysteine-containing dehydrogenase